MASFYTEIPLSTWNITPNIYSIYQRRDRMEVSPDLFSKGPQSHFNSRNLKGFELVRRQQEEYLPGKGAGKWKVSLIPSPDPIGNRSLLWVAGTWQLVQPSLGLANLCEQRYQEGRCWSQLATWAFNLAQLLIYACSRTSYLSPLSFSPPL